MEVNESSEQEGNEAKPCEKSSKDSTKLSDVQTSEESQDTGTCSESENENYSKTNFESKGHESEMEKPEFTVKGNFDSGQLKLKITAHRRSPVMDDAPSDETTDVMETSTSTSAASSSEACSSEKAKSLADTDIMPEVDTNIQPKKNDFKPLPDKPVTPGRELVMLREERLNQIQKKLNEIDGKAKKASKRKEELKNIKRPSSSLGGKQLGKSSILPRDEDKPRPHSSSSSSSSSANKNRSSSTNKNRISSSNRRPSLSTSSKGISGRKKMGNTQGGMSDGGEKSHGGLLLDGEVPDLSESLTETLVQTSNDSKGAESPTRTAPQEGGECNDSLQELGEADLAALLPEVAPTTSAVAADPNLLHLLTPAESEDSQERQERYKDVEEVMQQMASVVSSPADASASAGDDEEADEEAADSTKVQAVTSSNLSGSDANKQLKNTAMEGTSKPKPIRISKSLKKASHNEHSSHVQDGAQKGEKPSRCSDIMKECKSSCKDCGSSKKSANSTGSKMSGASSPKVTEHYSQEASPDGDEHKSSVSRQLDSGGVKINPALSSPGKKKRGRPPKRKTLMAAKLASEVEADRGIGKGRVGDPQPPEALHLVGYNMSNVSPDSGIQSVSGSPANAGSSSPHHQHQPHRHRYSAGLPPAPSGDHQSGESDQQVAGDHDEPPVLENMKEAEFEPVAHSSDQQPDLLPVMTHWTGGKESIEDDNVSLKRRSSRPKIKKTKNLKPDMPVKSNDKPKRGRPKGSTKKKSKNILHKLSMSSSKAASVLQQKRSRLLDRSRSESDKEQEKRSLFALNSENNAKRTVETILSSTHVIPHLRVQIPLEGISTGAKPRVSKVPVKRGRGRPKKVPLDDQLLVSSKSQHSSHHALHLSMKHKLIKKKSFLKHKSTKPIDPLPPKSDEHVPYSIGPPDLSLGDSCSDPVMEQERLNSTCLALGPSLSSSDEDEGTDSENIGQESTISSQDSELLCCKSTFPSKDDSVKNKPKLKKPKLHVMMRQHKKRRKRKPHPLELMSDQVPTSESETPNCASFVFNPSYEIPLPPYHGGKPGGLPLCALPGGLPSKGLPGGPPIVRSSMEDGLRPDLRGQLSLAMPASPISPASSGKRFTLPSPGSKQSSDSRTDSSSRYRRKRKKNRQLDYKPPDTEFSKEVDMLSVLFSNISISAAMSRTLQSLTNSKLPMPKVFKLSKLLAKRSKKKEYLQHQLWPLGSQQRQVFHLSSLPPFMRDISVLELDFVHRHGHKRKSLLAVSNSDAMSTSSESTNESEQCLTLKKRQKSHLKDVIIPQKGASEVSQSSKSSPKSPEKRRVGRPRKNPLPDTSHNEDKDIISNTNKDATVLTDAAEKNDAKLLKSKVEASSVISPNSNRAKKRVSNTKSKVKSPEPNQSKHKLHDENSKQNLCESGDAKDNSQIQTKTDDGKNEDGRIDPTLKRLKSPGRPRKKLIGCDSMVDQANLEENEHLEQKKGLQDSKEEPAIDAKKVKKVKSSSKKSRSKDRSKKCDGAKHLSNDIDSEKKIDVKKISRKKKKDKSKNIDRNHSPLHSNTKSPVKNKLKNKEKTVLKVAPRFDIDSSDSDSEVLRKPQRDVDRVPKNTSKSGIRKDSNGKSGACDISFLDMAESSSDCDTDNDIGDLDAVDDSSIDLSYMDSTQSREEANKPTISAFQKVSSHPKEKKSLKEEQTKRKNKDKTSKGSTITKKTAEATTSPLRSTVSTEIGIQADTEVQADLDVGEAAPVHKISVDVATQVAPEDAALFMQSARRAAERQRHNEVGIQTQDEGTEPMEPLTVQVDFSTSTDPLPELSPAACSPKLQSPTIAARSPRGRGRSGSPRVPNTNRNESPEIHSPHTQSPRGASSPKTTLSPAKPSASTSVTSPISPVEELLVTAAFIDKENESSPSSKENFADKELPPKASPSHTSTTSMSSPTRLCSPNGSTLLQPTQQFQSEFEQFVQTSSNKSSQNKSATSNKHPLVSDASSGTEVDVCVIDDSDRDVIVIDEDENEDEDTEGCEKCSELQEETIHSQANPTRRGPGRPRKGEMRGSPPKPSPKSRAQKKEPRVAEQSKADMRDRQARSNKRHKNRKRKHKSTERSTSHCRPLRQFPPIKKGRTTHTAVVVEDVDVASISATEDNLNSDSDTEVSDGELSSSNRKKNSEFEPLPCLKKKSKRSQEDMGYSKPKRKRRKKKNADDSSAAEDDTLQSDQEEIIVDLVEEGTCYSSQSDRTILGYSSQSDVPGTSTPITSMRDIPQLPRKKYQRAGLFSNTYKDDESGSPRKKSRTDRKTAAYVPEDHEHGLLPPPIHVGKYLRQTRTNFTLPYDIWWMNEHNVFEQMKQLTPKYKKIRHNVYVDAKPVCKDYEPHSCNCKRSADGKEKGCGDSCLNRLVFTECNPNCCPCGDLCSNRKIQRLEWCDGLDKFQTENRGNGVRTTKKVESGTFLLEYVGEVVSEQLFRQRMTEEYHSERHHYCLNLDGGMVIDGYRMGNICRFVNHSCEPNCQMEKWNVNGVYRVGLFAMGDIDPKKEITYDYNFHNYNVDSQQECRCGSKNCRGVVGDRGHRINGQLRDKSPRSTKHGEKDKRKSKNKLKKRKKSQEQQMVTPIKPMSHRERCFAQKHAVFLLRNIEKVRQLKHQPRPPTPHEGDPANKDQLLKASDVFRTKFMALNTDRSVKTRRLALAEEDGELARTARLAQIFQLIFNAVSSTRGENGTILCTPLMTLPTRKKHPEYYNMIEEPIDMNMIEGNILSGKYMSVDMFEDDFLRLFRNVEKYCGKKSDIGTLVAQLRKVYLTARTESTSNLEEILGDGIPSATHSECELSETQDDTKSQDGEEEVIRCICGILREEGLMIQCDKCEIWQHCDCVGVSGEVDHYLCELCCPRAYSKEVAMVPQPEDAKPGCTYYMSLLRGELQVRLGDCVYLMKESLEEPGTEGGTPTRLSYRHLQHTNPTRMDVFRVERLWKDTSGERFAMGHYYLRPHETFHEPSRKFFQSEVFRIPLYEIIPLEAVVAQCFVLDPATYCRGRPRGTTEQDVYVCEYRVDKTAHFFYKINKIRFPVNTKSYCFDRFAKKLPLKRTYSPHEVPDAYKKRLLRESVGPGGSTASSISGDGNHPEHHSSHQGVMHSDESDSADLDEEDVPLSRVKEKKMQRKRTRLDNVLKQLLSLTPTRQHLDVTYLFGGRHKRQSHPH